MWHLMPRACSISASASPPIPPPTTITCIGSCAFVSDPAERKIDRPVGRTQECEHGYEDLFFVGGASLGSLTPAGDPLIGATSRNLTPELAMTRWSGAACSRGPCQAARRSAQCRR